MLLDPRVYELGAVTRQTQFGPLGASPSPTALFERVLGQWLEVHALQIEILLATGGLGRDAVGVSREELLDLFTTVELGNALEPGVEGGGARLALGQRPPSSDVPGAFGHARR